MTTPGRDPFPYECFVMNLDRQPERLVEFHQWNGACGLEIKRFPAVDGSTVDERTRRIVSTSDRFTKGVIGNALTQKRLWEHAVETFRPITIFEDDAVLRSDIAEVLPAAIAGVGGFWDIVLLGFNTNSVLRLRPGTALNMQLRLPTYPSREDLVTHQAGRGPVTPLRLAHAFGLAGYVISPMGAKKLLKLCFPMDDRVSFALGFDRPILVGNLDTMMNSFYSALEAYICLPPLVLSPNDPETSGTLPAAQRKPAKSPRRK